jgi:formimidoylglutamate deiminase
MNSKISGFFFKEIFSKLSFFFILFLFTFLGLKSETAAAQTAISTGRVLFEKSVQGGALSTQRETGEISPGKWADLISLDISNINLNGTYRDTTIDSWIFASNRNSIKEVWSAGSKIVQNGEHLSHQKITDRYRKTLSSLRNRI